MLESGHEGRTELVRAGVDLFIHRFGSPALPVLIVVHGGSTWDHSYLLPGALSRAMAYAGAPFDIWRLDRLEDWHWVLAGIRFSSDWDAPHAAGQLRPAPPRQTTPKAC